MTVLFIWYTLAENIYLRSLPEKEKLPSCVLIFKHLGLPKAVIFYSMQIISSSLKNYRRKEYLTFLIYTHYIMAAFFTLLFFGSSKLYSEFVYMSYFLFKTLQRERSQSTDLQSNNIEKSNSGKKHKDVEKKKKGAKGEISGFINPIASDPYTFKDYSGKSKHLEELNDRTERQLLSQGISKFSSRRNSALDTNSIKLRHSMINRTHQERRKRRRTQDVQDLETKKSYKDRITEVKKEEVFLGELDKFLEIDNSAIASEPVLGIRSKMPQIRNPLASPIAQRNQDDKRIDEEASVSSTVNKQFLSSELSREVNKPQHDKSLLNDSMSNWDKFDPFKHFSSKQKQLKNLVDEENDVTKMWFGGNQHEHAQDDAEEDPQKIVIQDVVWKTKTADEEFDQASMSVYQYVLQKLKEEKKANVWLSNQKASLQKLTEIDKFFIQNYFKLSFMQLDSRPYQYNSDMFKDDNAVFKRVASPDPDFQIHALGSHPICWILYHLHSHLHCSTLLKSKNRLIEERLDGLIVHVRGFPVAHLLQFVAPPPKDFKRNE